MKGRDDAGREEKSSLAAKSKQIGDGIRAAIAGVRLDPPGSRGSGAHRAQRRGQPGRPRAPPGAADTLVSSLSVNKPFDYFDTVG